MNKKELYIIFIFSVTLIPIYMNSSFSNATVVDSEMGILVYTETTTSRPQMRFFNTTRGSFENSEHEVGFLVSSNAADAADVQFACSPVAEECALLVGDQLEDLYLQFYSMIGGSYCWNNGATCNQSTTLETNLFATEGKRFNLIYENQSGELLVVWAVNSDDSIDYALWNGTLNNHETMSGLVTAGTPEWIELASEPGTNNISMGYTTSKDEAGILEWDGTKNKWMCEMSSAVISLSATHMPRVGIAYEQSSGDVFAVFGTNTTTIKFAQKTKGSCSYNQSTTTFGEQQYMIRLAPAWTGNAIVVGWKSTNGDDDEWSQWTGTKWPANSPGDTSTYPGAAGNSFVASACVMKADKCIHVYSDCATGNCSEIDWNTLVPSSDTWTAKTDSSTNGMGDEEEAIECYPTPTGTYYNDTILCIFEDDSNELWAKVYDNSLDTWMDAEPTTLELEFNTSMAEYQAFDFDFMRKITQRVDVSIETSNPASINAGETSNIGGTCYPRYGTLTNAFIFLQDNQTGTIQTTPNVADSNKVYANVSSTGCIGSVWFGVNNGSGWRNYTGSLTNPTYRGIGNYSYTLNSANFSGGETVSWTVYSDDCNNHTTQDGTRTFYINRRK